MNGVVQHDDALTPTRDEWALGSLIAPQPGAPGLEEAARAHEADAGDSSAGEHAPLTPRAALERVLTGAVQRGGPCLVMFSGGYDSSLLLALTAHVARREGAPPPIPVTHRYDDPLAEESEWQELVLAHLGLPDWVRVQVGGRHDLLGPEGTAVLRRHGPRLPPLWWVTRRPPEAGGTPIGAPPATTDDHATLITGNGGDELFPAIPWAQLNRLLSGDLRALRRPRTLLRDLTPRRRTTAQLAAAVSEELTWVRPEHRSRLARQRADEIAAITRIPYRDYVAYLWASRGTRAALHGQRLGVRDSGAQLLNPLQHPLVLAAFAHRYGARFPGTRSAGYAEIADGLLPAKLHTRTTKAVGGSAFFGEATRAWVEAWDGDGPDADLVNGQEVRRLLLACADGRDDGSAAVAGLVTRAYHAQLAA